MGDYAGLYLFILGLYNLDGHCIRSIKPVINMLIKPNKIFMIEILELYHFGSQLNLSGINLHIMTSHNMFVNAALGKNWNSFSSIKTRGVCWFHCKMEVCWLWSLRCHFIILMEFSEIWLCSINNHGPPSSQSAVNLPNRLPPRISGFHLAIGVSCVS